MCLLYVLLSYFGLVFVCFLRCTHTHTHVRRWKHDWCTIWWEKWQLDFSEPAGPLAISAVYSIAVFQTKYWPRSHGGSRSFFRFAHIVISFLFSNETKPKFSYRKKSIKWKENKTEMYINCCRFKEIVIIFFVLVIDFGKKKQSENDLESKINH